MSPASNRGAMAADFSFFQFDTPLGAAGIVWRMAAETARIIRIFLPADKCAIDCCIQKQFPAAAPATHPSIYAISQKIGAFTAGNRVVFSFDMLDWEVCRPFQQLVLLTEARIPRGRVSTYGRIAAHLSAPRAARAVGHALARNPFPLIIPCHRAVRSDGGLGGFQGGLAMKRRLLELEGVAFSPSGKAVLSKLWF
jgi:methylated-DNA-[protein]-cysteine S-methyltransferase